MCRNGLEMKGEKEVTGRRKKFGGNHGSRKRNN